MKALIDGDLLAYECSACGQVKDKESGDLIIKGFGEVSDMLDQRIKEICAESFSDEEPKLYLTGDEKLFNLINKARIRGGLIPTIFKPNFRKGVAKTKPYKGNRKTEKPFHFDNIRAYMISAYDCIVTDGMEADDKICIDQYTDYLNQQYQAKYNDVKDQQDGELTVISCSRDKDLRINPGLHYRWACGKQPADGPTFVTELGELTASEGKPRKFRGSGLKFFYFQLITGDPTDNIQGLPGGGPVLAYNTLSNLNTEKDMFRAVKALYEGVYQGEWDRHLREMTDLLWMIREENEDGSLKFYEWPEGGALSQDQEVRIPDVVENGLKLSSEVL